MNFSHRFFLYGPFAMFVAFAAGVMIYWCLCSGRAVERTRCAQRPRDRARRAHAFRIETDRRISLPRSTRYTDDFSIEVRGAKGPITWHARRIRNAQSDLRDRRHGDGGGRSAGMSWTADRRCGANIRFHNRRLRASTVIEAGKLCVSMSIRFRVGGRLRRRARAIPFPPQSGTVDALDLVIDLQAMRIRGRCGGRISQWLSPCAHRRQTCAGRIHSAACSAGDARLARRARTPGAPAGLLQGGSRSCLLGQMRRQQARARPLDEAHRSGVARLFIGRLRQPRPNRPQA